MVQALRGSGQSSIVPVTLGPAGRDRLRQRSQKRERRCLPGVLCMAVAALALFTVVLWPSKSFAAIVPACENDFQSRMAVTAQAEGQDASCEPAATGDDIDNSRVAPICDLRGASAIAPPRLHGVTDLRFDRGRACEGTDSFKTAVDSGRGDPPVSPREATIEHVVLPSPEIVGPAVEVRLIDLPVRTDGPRMGVRLSIYHPPR